MNAGAALSTTYGANDASLPVLSWDVVANNIAFYATHHKSTHIVAAALAAYLAVLIFRHRLSETIRSSTLLLLTVNLVVGLSYFLTHKISISYYLVPLSAWILFTGAFAGIAPLTLSPRFAAIRSALAFSVTGGMFVAVIAMDLDVNFKYQPRETTVSVPQTTMVWGDLSTGTFVYHLDVHAAKLPWLRTEEIRHYFFSALNERGVEQVIVADSQTMRRFVDEFQARGTLTEIGVVFGFPTYRLVPRSRDAQTNGPEGR